MTIRAGVHTTSTAQAESVLVPRLVGTARMTRLPDGRLRITGPGASVTMPPMAPGLTDALALLDGNSTTLSQMIVQVDAAGSNLTSLLVVHLARLSAQGLLTHHVLVDGDELATIEPTGARYQFLLQPIPDTRPLHLSRFTVLRREDDHLLVESALGHGLVSIRSVPVMALVAMLAAPLPPAALRAHAASLGISDAVVAALITMLMNGRHLERPVEQDSDDLKLWNPHDLVFHMSSRFGRFGGPYGGGFRHIDQIDPAPALKPPPEGPRIPLPVPALEEMMASDPPLQQVVETRSSIYQYGDPPITIDDLGEFLYRVARVRWTGHQAVSSTVTGKTGQMEVSSRPTPAGGRGYELELYLTVAQCDGVPAGLYHYDAAGHALTRLRPADTLTEQMLAYASIASPGAQPQILITMAARFRRMMWKYDRLAYAATLKHVGVMMHQMYLAATAMHLAPSALGSGNIETFAAATGLDPIVEGSVGEFILGTSTREPRPYRPAMLFPDAPS